jgi:hypothetical protein
MTLSEEREAVMRDVAASEIRSGGASDRTLEVEDVLDIYGDVVTEEEAKRVLELIETATVTISWEEEEQ